MTSTITLATKLTVGLLFVSQAAASGWDYHDPDAEWGHSYPLCESGESQSPIDVDTTALTYPSSPLSLTIDFDEDEGEWEGMVANNGHSLQWTAEDPDESSMALTDVPGTAIGTEFNLKQIHLHWGVNSSSGSEHTIGGVAAAAEMHFVHYDNAYEFGVAANTTQGLAVIGVLIDEGEVNMYLEPIIAALRGDNDMLLNNDGNGTAVDLNIKAAVQAISTRFYTYAGSLTTPGCYESVTWILSAERMTMSAEQLNVLRGAYSSDDMDHHIAPNYRPTQPLNGRTVTASFVEPSGSPTVSPNSTATPTGDTTLAPTAGSTLAPTAGASSSFVAFSAVCAFAVAVMTVVA